MLIYLAMAAPALIIYLFSVTYPVFYSLWLSFTDFNPNRGGNWNWMGFYQYRTMLEDPNFWHALKNNLIVAAVSVFGQIPIGFILAYLLYRSLVKAANFFSNRCFFAPLPVDHRNRDDVEAAFSGGWTGICDHSDTVRQPFCSV